MPRQDFSKTGGPKGKPRTTDFDPRKAAIPATPALPVTNETSVIPVTHDTSKQIDYVIGVDEASKPVVIDEVLGENEADQPLPEDTKPAKTSAKPKKK